MSNNGQSRHLFIIIVSWNVRDLLRRCVQTCSASLAHTAIPTTMMVVDNNSSDGSTTMLREAFPFVNVMALDENVGFAAANNVALAAIMHQHCLHNSYVLLLNPDTQPHGDAIAQLVRYLDEHPETIAVGPQLRYGDGTLQSSRRRFPTRMMLWADSTLLERVWHNNPWRQRYHYVDGASHTPHAVDWLVGAALLVRGSAIASAGLLDDTFFMYSEELEWQHRLHAAAHHNNAVMYLPSAVVTHYEGKSSEQVVAKRHIYFQRSKLQLARMWYGRFFATMLSLFIQLGYVWELLMESVKYLLGHRHELRRERIAVYGYILSYFYGMV